MGTRFVVNGKTYDDPASMPEDVRKLYEGIAGSALADHDGDGVPDLVQRGTGTTTLVTTKIVYDGRTYEDIAELPAEVRPAVEKALATARPGSKSAGAPVSPGAPIEPEGSFSLGRVAVSLALMAALGLLALVFLMAKG